jgi:tetratricopeptide (TPR) repeat protein
MKPFLPLYQGKPANLSGFFKRGNDENLIVLALPPTNSAFTGLEVIFHEYAHVLFRHNALIWPLWLNEGMADVYCTFETTGYTIRIGRPMQPYVRLLTRQGLLPLSQLFAVTRDSPQYNERERQGIFYAQSWLLTHYLMAGGELNYQARFGAFTRLLRGGQFPEQAFTNALRTSLATMDAELRRYLERGVFAPIQWAVPMNLASPKALTTRTLTPVETGCRLGDVLLRIGRLDAAGSYFARAQKLAPASPLPHEGLGLLAVEREQHDEAVRCLKEALRCGSTSFLAWFTYAREKYGLTAEAGNRYGRLPKTAALEIRSSLQKSIALMPDFGPAHQLLGFFETVQDEDLTAAEKHLQLAIQLEPDNPSYLVSLAQLQFRKRDPGAARRTLEPLLLPNADPKLRQHAEELVRDFSRIRPSK